ARVQEGGFDAVVMDVQMPAMDGYTAARRIRQWEREQEIPPVPIIILSAHEMTEEAARLQAAGCDHYLTKPLRKPPLLDLLHKIAGPTLRTPLEETR
ncbi:MAG: response regulator, partial [Magnetococcus sp. DMHC-8]